MYSSSAPYPKQLLSSAHSGKAESIQITHCLAARVPSLPNPVNPDIDNFNVLYHTLGLAMYVWLCVHEKEKSCGSAILSLTLCWSGANILYWDKKYGDSASLYVQINTNEQRLAEVVLAVFRLEEWDRAIHWAFW